MKRLLYIPDALHFPKIPLDRADIKRAEQDVCLSSHGMERALAAGSSLVPHRLHYVPKVDRVDLPEQVSSLLLFLRA